MSSYSRMVVIPQEEYVQLSAMQQVRQPLAQQVYQSEQDYQNNLHIKDPHRAVLMQSETIERLKDLKDQMRHYLTVSTPKPYRSRAEALFQSIEPWLNVNEKGEIIQADNSVIESSRVEDLIQHAVRDRRRSFVPTGWSYFINLLKQHNVPKSSLNRETLDELDAPASKHPSKLPPPKNWTRVKKEPKTPPLKNVTLRSKLPIRKRSRSAVGRKTSPAPMQRRGRSREKRRRVPPQKYMFTKY